MKLGISKEEELKMTNNNNNDIEAGCVCTDEKNMAITFCTVAALVVVGLLGFGFYQIGVQRVEYNEYAFKKDTWSNRVDTDKLYRNGRYFWGYASEPIIFPSTCQFVSIPDLSVSDKEEKSFGMTVEFCYKLIPEELKNLYKQYGTEYTKIIRSTVEATIKNKTPEYSIQEYLDDRYLITDSIAKNVTEALQEIWIEVPENKFYIVSIHFEKSTLNEYEKIAVDYQNNLKSEYDQEITFINQNTTKFVEEIDALASLEIEKAKSNFDSTIDIANAQAFNITQSARGVGMSETMEELGVTNSTTFLFIRLMDILDNENDAKILNTGDSSVLLNV